MSALIKLIAFGLIGYLLYIFLFKSDKKERYRRQTRRGPEEMKQDPNCHTFIPESQALKREISGKTYYFCSEQCYREFQAANRQ